MLLLKKTFQPVFQLSDSWHHTSGVMTDVEAVDAETTSLLKTSKSSSHISTGLRKPSLIQRSLSTHFKRVSIAAETEDKPPVKKVTSYGTLYPSIYHKLSKLHRLSFADVIERITLTWSDVNVYAPASKTKLIGKVDSRDAADLQPKHILKNGIRLLLTNNVFLLFSLLSAANIQIRCVLLHVYTTALCVHDWYTCMQLIYVYTTGIFVIVYTTDTCVHNW